MRLPSAVYVPTLYFAEGLVYVLVNTVSVVLYKKMGVSNSLIAFATSFLYLPWVIKMLWGPLVDGTATKRRWIVLMQMAIGVMLIICAFGVQSPWYFSLTLALFTCAAIFSATHDIAVDGFYMIALDDTRQAFFVGIRSLFYRLAMIFGSGFLVYLAGHFEGSMGIAHSWSLVLSVSGVIYLLLALLHWRTLPVPVSDKAAVAVQGEPSQPFVQSFKTYFARHGILAIVLFIVLYRFGEALLVKMIAPFCLDGHDAGGLGLTTSQVGVVYGTVGITSLVIGGIAGGAIIARFGIRRCIWPFALVMNLPMLFFIFMAVAKPALPYVYLMVAFEQLGYGLGMTSLMVVLIHSSKGLFKTSHFAISTGIMAIGMMVPGMISGKIQQSLGYPGFFTLTALLTIPGMILIAFLPLKDFDKPSTE